MQYEPIQKVVEASEEFAQANQSEAEPDFEAESDSEIDPDFEPDPDSAANLGPDVETDVDAEQVAVEADWPADWIIEDEAPKQPPKRRLWQVVAGVVLVLLIIAQVIYLMFPSWSKDPDTRWLSDATCAVVGCELDPLRVVDQLVLNNVIVRDHADKPGVLVVDVLFVNTAPFAQGFPEIELTFNTDEGQLVAWRRFKPVEYLSDPQGDKREIGAKTPVHVSVEIKDPGPGSDRYEVSLR